MKTLIDKLIYELTEEKKLNSRSVGYCDGITYAISVILEVTKEAEFKDIAGLLIKYMAEKHNPHTSAIITDISAELVESIYSTGSVR